MSSEMDAGIGVEGSEVSAPWRDTRDDIVRELTTQRQRTLELIAALTDAQLIAQHSPLQSPIVWDLGHIADFEEQWIIDAVDGGAAVRACDPVYDPLLNPRALRGRLRLPRPDEVRERLRAVRGCRKASSASCRCHVLR